MFWCRKYGFYDQRKFGSQFEQGIRSVIAPESVQHAVIGCLYGYRNTPW